MRLEESTVDIDTPTGPMRTYLYKPVGPKRPALVVYSEIFQQTAPIARLAARLAGHGFLVAVPEVYHEYLPAGTVLGYDTPGSEKGNELKTTKPVAAFDSDAAALVTYLKGVSNGSVGAFGVCLGGHLAYRAALHPDVKATACFYATDIHSGTLGHGKKDDSLARTGDIQGELLMGWGRQDPHVPSEGRATIYKRLEEAKRTFTWHEFNAAHAFMRDEGPRYDPGLTRLCTELALELFYRTLN